MMRWADDFDEIRKHRDEIQKRESLIRERRCAVRENRSVSECWCYHAAPGGGNLPCPPPAPSA